jgi:hypothetical protein
MKRVNFASYSREAGGKGSGGSMAFAAVEREVSESGPEAETRET